MSEPDRLTFPVPPAVVSQPVADIQATQTGEGNAVTYTYPIRQPEEDLQDFQVGVRASVLRRCRARLSAMKRLRFPWPELLLGTSTLAAGATLSAVIAGLQLDSWRGIVFFVFVPMLFVGSGVAYLMLRHFTMQSTCRLAADILDDLPDPGNSI